MDRQFLNHIVVCLCLLASAPSGAAADISLERAIALAIESDPVLEQSRAEQQAFLADAAAAGELPDAQLSVAISNLPTDSFSFSQEPMTQINVGVSQLFPGGGKRAFAADRLTRLGTVAGIDQRTRLAEIRLQVTRLWTEAARIDGTSRLIAESRGLFEQLRDVTRGRYNTATRQVSQQDVIRAEIEVSRLEERLLGLREQKSRIVGQLSQWVPVGADMMDVTFTLPEPAEPGGVDSIMAHPAVRAMDERIAAARDGLSLVRSETASDWRVQTSYAYRNEDFTGRDLPDFVSVGVTMDLTLFSKRRTSREIEAAAQRVSAIESARLMSLRKLNAELKQTMSVLAQLDRQVTLFDESLLPKSASLSRAALSAYQSDEGDFADVIRAYISELDTRVDALTLKTKRQNALNTLEYLGTTAPAAGEEI